MPNNSTKGLMEDLPPWYPNSETSGVFKMLDAVGHEVDNVVSDQEAVDRAMTVQHADSIAQLEEHGELVRTSYRDGEGIESYRTRIIVAFMLNTSEGTPEDLLLGAAEALPVSAEDIRYKKTAEGGNVELEIPSQALDASALSVEGLTDAVGALLPAGYSLSLTTRGSLRYTDPTTYSNTTDWSGTPGYDTLDANGDPIGEGGTYSGLL